ncbi:MAG: protein kinase [Blastocatellia bacterium]
MNNQRWQAVERLFNDALEMTESGRAAYLDAACKGDDTLRREVESLLSAESEAARQATLPLAVRLDSTALPVLQTVAPSADQNQGITAGLRLGSYRLLREIGSGGMGAVWLAERADDEFRQLVAVKLVRPSTGSREVVRRFRHERQILASLEHPNIARLLDGGTSAEGQPYFVMEYIEGLPIDEYCHRHRLSVIERLKLFLPVCAAVQYAHQNLVIHRDLKPGNIFVTADGTPKLLDFGIAKLLLPDLAQSCQTQGGQTPMTPAYASPEQVRGLQLTTTSDVYSLGVVLYELLTGRSPYQLSEGTLNEMMRVVAGQEPERPSLAILRLTDEINSRISSEGTEVSDQSHYCLPETADKLRRRLAGDLDAITLMALRKEPQSRYSSVEHFAADIRRYLDGLPVTARRGTLGYRAARFMRRHRIPIAAAALIVLSLTGGIAATLRQARIARHAQVLAEDALVTADERRRQAETARSEAEAQRVEANAQRAAAETQQTLAETQRALAEAQRRRAEAGELSNRRLLYASQMRLAQTAWEESNAGRVDELLRPHLPEAGRPDLRGFEWFWLWQVSHLELVNLPLTWAVTSAAFSPDGKSLVTIETSMPHEEVLSITDTTTWRIRHQVREKGNERFEGKIGRRAVFSRDGRVFATGGNSCGLSLWETATGKRLRTIAQSDCNFRGVAFSPDGRRLAAGHLNGKILIFDAQSGQELQSLAGHSKWVNGITFSPDGHRLATTSAVEEAIRLWDADTGRELFTVKKKFSAYMNPAFSPDSQFLAIGEAREVLIIDVRTGKMSAPFRSNGSPLSLDWSPDGSILAVASSDWKISLLDTHNWQLVNQLRGFSAPVLTMSFAPDGQRLVTGTNDHRIQVWDWRRSQDPAPLRISDRYADKVAFADAGKKLFVLGADLITRAYDTLTHRELFSLKGHYLEKPYVTPIALMHALAVSGDGKIIATTADESIRIREAATGRELRHIRTPGKRNYIMALSQDGRMVATDACACTEDTSKKVEIDHAEYFGVWDTKTGKQLLNFRTLEIAINRIVFLKDNRTLVTVGMNDGGQLTWWNLATGRPVRTINPLVKGGLSLTLSPDGRRLAVASADGKISFFDAITGQPTGLLRGYSTAVREMYFSPDGNRLLTGGGMDRVVKLWDLTTGQEVMAFRDTSSMAGPAFAPDGRSIAIPYAEGLIKILSIGEQTGIGMAQR